MKKTKPEMETLESPIIEAVPAGAHYVDNKKFYQALIEYKKLVDASKVAGEDLPIVPNYIGECFIKIATHLSYKGNFINYSFKDDMISDGIENCLTAVSKFDPEKSTNPFAYYTQVIYFAFIRRIQKEKKQQIAKYKMIENMDIDQIISQEGGDSEFNSQFIDYLKRQLDTVDIDKREMKKPKKNKLAEEIVENPLDI